VVASAATALAYALAARMELPWGLLLWVGLVPWLAAVDRLASFGGALAAGLLLSVAYEFAVFGWFADSIATYASVSRPTAGLVLVILSPILQPQLPAVAMARHWLRRRGAPAWRCALGSACVWVGVEWASPKLFADTLGYMVYPFAHARQIADVGGMGGLTLVVILVNDGVLAIVRAVRDSGSLRERMSRALLPIGAVAALLIAPVGYGHLRWRALAAAAPAADVVTAGLVQADIFEYDQLATTVGKFATVRGILDRHFALSSELLGRTRLDLLVWPETVYPTTFGTPKTLEGAAFDAEIAGFVNNTGVPLVFGSYDADGASEFNAAVFLEPSTDGRVSFDTYRKARLFPLTEWVPGVLGSERVRRWLPWLGTWTAGPGPEVIAVALSGGRTLRIGPLICYDITDPWVALAEVRRGAELILTLSNDAWFTGGGPRLNLVGAAFRSIETRRPQLRATNTGISAVITPLGEFVALAGEHEQATLVASVHPLRHPTTPLLAWGDWLGPTSVVIALVLLAVPRASRNR